MKSLQPARPLCILSVSAVGVLLTACGNPFATTDADRGLKFPTERLRSVRPLVLSEQTPAPPEIDKPATPTADPFFGFERKAVTIEEVRQWTLENNLDLKVVLVDPAIAQQTQNVEEAKFEWLLFNNTRYADLDQPTASQLEGSQLKNLDIDTGVQIPLREGGTITVNLPLNRTETNNSFSTLNPSYESDLTFSISQPLLRNAGRRFTMHSIRIAALDNQIVQARTNLEVIRQLADVDRAYWRLYAAKRILEVRQKQYELADAQLKRAKRRVDAGVSPEVEVIRSESGVAQQLEAIIVAQTDLRRLQRDLKRRINAPGLEIGSPLILETATEPDPVKYTLDPRPLADGAIANRMEMLELELQLAQDLSTIDFEKNQALPLATLDYSYNINGLGSSFNRSFDQLNDNKFEDWTLAARVEVPLGNEAAKSRVHRAILTRLQRLGSREARILAIKQEVFDAVDNLNTAWQRIMASRQAAILDARTLQAEERQFEVGSRTSTDVLDAAATLAESQSAEITALTDYMIAQVDLAFATGTLLGAAKVEWTPSDPSVQPAPPSAADVTTPIEQVPDTSPTPSTEPQSNPPIEPTPSATSK